MPQLAAAAHGLRLATHDAIATITIDHLVRMNALSAAM